MSYADLQALGQKRLDAVCEIGFGARLWPKQREIAIALSERRSRVVVPSCNASGKTFLAARLALAFYWTYPDAKVITTSSTEPQLKDALWAEIRTAYESANVPIPGKLPPADMWLRDGNNHFIKGTVARHREGFQGIHSAHKLIIADEASSIDEEAASGINGLLSTGDARLLVILNPTSDDSWAADQAGSNLSTVIKITAFDTPHLSQFDNTYIQDRWGQELPTIRKPVAQSIPEGSNLTSADWLDEMVANGSGPGTVEWTNRVMAEFWSSAESQLIIAAWINLAKKTERDPGFRVLGIDLAPHGDDENVIAYRVGNALIRVEALPSI
ncbi:MAG: terminase large subunit domain-containing protein, partial [Bacteroidota bacterium]